MNNNSIKFSSAYLEALAERQFKDYKKKNPGSYFAENINNLTIEDAYVVQKEFSSLRCLNGDNIVGYKVGCIGPVVIEQFGMAGPVYGRIFEKEIYISGSKIFYKNFFNLAIEGEMAVIIGENMEISKAFPVIELHNFIFQGKSKSITELIDNNAINAGAVLSDKDLQKPINDFSNSKNLSVKINDKIIDSGDLWAMSGGAEEAVIWLQKKLNHHGFSLEPGNIVLTGTPLSLHNIKLGDTISILIDNVEFVTCSIV